MRLASETENSDVSRPPADTSPGLSRSAPRRGAERGRQRCVEGCLRAVSASHRFDLWFVLERTHETIGPPKPQKTGRERRRKPLARPRSRVASRG